MEILSDKNNNKFLAIVDGKNAYVEYIETATDLNIIHTIVPDELAGKGLASKLVEYAYNYAQSKGLSFTPTCSYAIAWHTKHHFNNSSNEL